MPEKPAPNNQINIESGTVDKLGQENDLLETSSLSSEEKKETSGNFAFKTVGETDQDQQQINRNLDFILDIPLDVSVELGRSKIRIADILKLGQGSVIELSNPAGGSLEVLVNQKPVAKGEVVVVNEKYGVRLIEILSVIERIEKLR